MLFLVLWSICISTLTVFGILSYFIYRRGNNKIFLYYTLYCCFIVIYLLSKFEPTPFYTIVNTPKWQDFNWLIQILFYCAYYLFGIYFVNIVQPFPKFSRIVFTYVISTISLSVILFSAGVFLEKSFLGTFYGFVFIPVHIIVAFSIMHFALKVKGPTTLYFLTGSIIYIGLAVMAYVFTIQERTVYGFPPLSLFLLALIIESLIFSYALGLMIWNVYKKEKVTSVKLKEALTLLKHKLEETEQLRVTEKAYLLAQAQQQELKTKVVFLQSKILYEQINFHFIFNVLNSIKVFILENDNRKASQYLTKFSRFIRHALDNNRNELVSLSAELNNMETYLSIEKMRFEGRFEYKIEVEEMVDTHQHHIPTFLLQPFIENALWHGIMKIPSDGLIVVRVSENSKQLIIEIEDNGIGIEMSKAAKKENDKQSSYGISLVNEIVTHYNEMNNKKIRISVLDKKTFNTSGTLVQIVIDF